MTKWYIYLYNRCKKHIMQKQNNEFFPQSGEKGFFNLKNNMKQNW